MRKTIFSAEMYAWSGAPSPDYPEGTPDFEHPVYIVEDSSYGRSTRTNDNGEVVLIETLKLVSTSEPDALADFGTLREIASGRMFDSLNECIISEELARINNISVGDIIELRGTYARDKIYILTVAGIYSDNTDEYLNPWLTMFGDFYAQNRRNEIITSFETLLAVGWETNAGLDMKTEYFLKNPDDIRKFEEEVRSKGLPTTT